MTIGTGMGTLLAVWACVLAVLQGSTTITFRGGRAEIDLLTAIALYVMGGAAAGLLTGIMLPLAQRSDLGAAFVGSAAGFPFFFGGLVAIGEPARSGVTVGVAIALAIGMGAFLGIPIRRAHVDRGP
jgi:hypothetical protein